MRVYKQEQARIGKMEAHLLWIMNHEPSQTFLFTSSIHEVCDVVEPLPIVYAQLQQMPS